MEIASFIVVFVLFSSFWFYISLPFANKRERADEKSFGGIQEAYIGSKIIFALIMGIVCATVFYFVISSGRFANLYDGGL